MYRLFATSCGVLVGRKKHNKVSIVHSSETYPTIFPFSRRVVVTNKMHSALMSILSGRRVYFWDGDGQGGYHKIGGVFDLATAASNCKGEDFGAFYINGANETDSLIQATNAAVEYLINLPCE